MTTMTNDDDGFAQITEAGRKALCDDTQMHDEDRLILEIMAHVDAIGEENSDQICEEMTAHFGSAAAAIEAIKAGKVRFIPVPRDWT
jgi:hypothetical protein